MTKENIVAKAAQLAPNRKRNEEPLAPAVLTHPFRNIAVALSGGGFRAAAYSTGTLSYLQHLRYPTSDGEDKRLFDKINFISSASGGSIAGLTFATGVRKKRPFLDSYNRLIKFLEGEVLLGSVLKQLNDEKDGKEDKSKNLINAFSKKYNEELFQLETFGVFFPDPEYAPGRAIEICVNATEFYRGLTFRFQASSFGTAKGKTGNQYVYFDDNDPTALQTLKKIRLGDILAASSCFPAGFEPILFPKDFTYENKQPGKNLSKDELIAALTFTDYDQQTFRSKGQLGLMDGGINDNQALYSAMLADQRRRRNDKTKGFDLIFITDVASYFMKSYRDTPVENENTEPTLDDLLEQHTSGFIGKYSTYLSGFKWVMLIIALISLAATFKLTDQVWQRVALFILAMASTVVLVIYALHKFILQKPVKTWLPEELSYKEKDLAQFLKGKVGALQNFSDTTLTELIEYLKKTKITILKKMVLDRLNSTLSMVLDVNLKMTRRLIFGSFYGEFSGSEVWQNRRVFNVIYELSTYNMNSRLEKLIRKFGGDYAYGQEFKDNSWAQEKILLLTSGTEKLNGIAEIARTMGTTLWTDTADQKAGRIRDVVTCGQFTTCAKLVEYVLVIERVLWQQDREPQMAKQIILDDEQKKIYDTVKAQILEDWEKFKTEPYFLYDGYARIPKP